METWSRGLNIWLGKLSKVLLTDFWTDKQPLLHFKCSDNHDSNDSGDIDADDDDEEHHDDGDDD